VVLPAINGIPWWFFQPEGVPCSGLHLKTVDPDGAIERAVPLKHVVGLSVFASSASPAPGVVRHGAGQRFVFGEPGGGVSPRVEALTAMFSRAGFAAEASPNMRTDIWVKLLGNACFNPVSMLTLAHTDDMIDDPGLHQLFVRMMTESLAVAERLGLEIAIQPTERIASTRKMGHIKSSMLQDLEAGRGLEIEAILGALVECAQAAQVPTPTLETVLAIARGRAWAMPA
jgi:2-dehydropantoate 2-reductase